MKKLYISIFVAASCIGVSAQTLSTEVVVDRSVDAREREASRIENIYPEVVLPQSSVRPLLPSFYSSISAFDNDYSVLPVVEASLSPHKSPYRGYLAAGYFPLLNSNVSAGYRVVDKSALALDAFLQFNSERYSPYKKDEVENNRNYFLNGAVGLGLAWTPQQNSALTASVVYDYLNQSTLLWDAQSVNSLRIGTDWKSRAGNLSYHAGVKFSYESASDVKTFPDVHHLTYDLSGPSQLDFSFDAGLDYGLGRSAVGLDVAGDYLRTSVTTSTAGTTFDIIPHYSFKADKFDVRLGVKLNPVSFAGESKFHVMPDVHLAWKPVTFFSVSASVTGGSYLNSFATIRQESVYQIFTSPFAPSKVPVAVDGALNFGPFRGVYFGFFGGYALADSWLTLTDSALHPFAPEDISGWHAGAVVGLTHRFVDFSAKADFAPSDFDKAWYLYRDRAGIVVDASLKIKPIDPLSVILDYTFRSHRRAYSDETHFIGLGAVSDLSAGASWRFTPALTAFVRVQNILCRRYMILPHLPSAKLTGLVGIEFKF